MKEAAFQRAQPGSRWQGARAIWPIRGNTVFQNGEDGINASSGSIVQGNAVRSNVGYGLRLLFNTAYRENVITANTQGAVAGGVNLGDNYCAGTGVFSASCP